MKIGVTSWVWPDHSFDEVLAACTNLGIEHLELACGGFFPPHNCDARALLGDPAALREARERLEQSSITISALAVHGEPLHPDPTISTAYAGDLDRAIELAHELGVVNLTLLAGLPEAAEGDRSPNWVTYPYPARNLQVMSWQWEQRLLPYWRERVERADQAGVRFCFEIHPADMLHQPSRLLRLRDELGPTVGANLDPSHLIWQGADLVEVVHTLGDAIYNVHAKESELNEAVVRRDGVIDGRTFAKPSERSWSFRTIGYGQSVHWWRKLLSALRSVGYDGVLAYEHEDPLFDPDEGLRRGLELLRSSVPLLPQTPMWYEETE